MSFSQDLPVLWRIYAVTGSFQSVDGAEENGALAFVGIVDEQSSVTDAFDSVTRVYARSPAALALDSECEPGEYVLPSADVMYRRHLMPFGIKTDSLSNEKIGTEMSISRGASHYGAVRKFCETFLGTTPRIGSTGVFRSDAYLDGEELTFGSGGIGYSSIKVRYRRCCRISKVIAAAGGASVSVENGGAVSEGIERVRRIDLADSRTGTLIDADDLIAAGEKAAFQAQTVCRGCLGDIIGKRARIDIPGGEGLVIVKTKYTSNAGGETTTVTFARKEER